MSKTEFLLNEMYSYKGRQTIKQRNKMISDRDMCYEENKSDGIESQGVKGLL